MLQTLDVAQVSTQYRETKCCFSAVLREPPWGADGQTARAMLAQQASTKGGRGPTPNDTAKPLTESTAQSA